MNQNFDKALAFVLRDEGGNDDDPADHGGRTSRGITQREYTAWLREQGRPDGDVWKASDADVATIYRNEYWNPWCDLLPAGTDYVFFDECVNAGPHRAIVIGQRALGVDDDGRVGPVTRAAIHEADATPEGQLALLTKYDAQKRAFYQSLHQPRFLRGWLNRCDHVVTNAKTMIGT